MLHKTKGEIAEVILPLVDAEPSLPIQATNAFKSEDATAAKPKAELAEVAPSADKQRVSEIRTLSLHVAAPSPILPFEQGQWRPSEQYRSLRTKISQHPLQPHLIVISSPESGDGKSVSAINTAGALALKSEGQVLLVDGDLRKSAIHKQLGLPEGPGLANLLAGDCSLEEAVVRTQEFPSLYVMTSGGRPANPVELLDSVRWQALSAKLRSMFRYVIIDSPPVSAVADYELIQAVCDGVILVLRPDCTNRHLCQNALNLLPKSKFLGVLLNCVPDWSPAKYSGSYYYYNSAYEKKQDPKA
jgi:capsular exopolysaccharide synthesis family protein